MTLIHADTALSILNEHRQYFATGETRDVGFRIRQLAKLKQTMKSYESMMIQALFEDLHKSEYEAFTTEIGIIYRNIGYCIKKLKGWARPRNVRTPLSLFGARSYIYPEPYGTVLIIGPFNYPVNLVFEPLIGALAAGNCAVIKPSELTPRVSGVIARIIQESFNSNYVRVIEGDREVTQTLVQAPFDYIFFTGSIGVGKKVLQAAASNLVPVTLELGGKNPCIVDQSANIDSAARKIVWGKYINAGQTCVAPDYIVAHRKIKIPLLDSIKYYLERFYGANPRESPHFGRIVNTAHTERLVCLIDPDKVITGGDYDIQDRYISPTVLDRTNWEDRIMQDEIFGPLLPVLEFDDLDSVIEEINRKPEPLALYVFTKNKDAEKKILGKVSFGGGCINDTLLHSGNPDLPFGGVGASGIGAYHGKKSFETFSHRKSILKRTININAMVPCPPYTTRQFNLVKKFLR